jgi:D-lactate dehydrogenase
MSSPKLVFYGLWSELTTYVQERLRDFEVVIHEEKMNEHNLVRDTEVLIVFVDSQVTKKIMDDLPELKMIATMSTGYDHIDIGEAKKRGIVICNVPTYGDNTVAEHTFALLLGLTRKLFQSVKRVKEGRYDFHGLRGVDLEGKTIGVIGTGNIGTHVIRMAKGFSMKVVAYDVGPKKELADRLDFSYVPLQTLLAVSDVVTLHVPLLPTTHHLLNKGNMKSMKQGALLINTARGALVEPEALLEALNSGQISGAGLDVLEDEQLIQNYEEVISCSEETCKLKTSLINNVIIDHPNTIVTPHNAFNSTEALERILDVTIGTIRSFTAGTLSDTVIVK